ncbi:elongation factor [Trema orientale]|uniref:Elongation factor n=1 Tax=Trema orientale TaxID=63057 RepID=A0A2P5FW75_TREOI|nr:elongation factor [Trema orientale]
MSPAQPLMDVEVDCKPNINAQVAPENGNKSSLTVAENLAMRCLSCSSNFEDSITGMEDLIDDQNKVLEEVDVDITEWRNDSDIRLAEKEDPDATEYSSSFEDTASDAENCSGFCEGEVESQFFGDNGFASSFDALGSVFQMRKKKLTNHWRSFIRPVMWRCKWMELRIKEIDSQVSKYSRELAAYDQGKHPGLEQFISEGFCSKSFPFSSQYMRKKAMKRRKRKKVEDATDVTSYMSQHNLFSYLENKKSDPDSTYLADEFGNAATTEQNADCNDKLGTSDDWTSFEFKDSDVSMEQVLWNIEKVHSWVQKLKGQIDTVMSKNAAKFSSSENLSLLAPLNVQTSSAHSPAFSTGNADAISAEFMYTENQHLTDYDIGGIVLPESVVSSFGEAISVPDIIESTVGLLSSADVTLHQAQFGDSSEDIVDNVLLHDEAAEGEENTFQRLTNQSQENHQQEPEICGQEALNPSGSIPSSEQPDPMLNGVAHHEQSTLTSCLASDVHFPRGKRKRGERKAGSVVWNKRCSGDTDSQ